MENQNDDVRIREIIQSWAEAVRNIDIKGILANHSEDILMFDVPPPLESKGIAEYEETWVYFYQYFKKGDTWELRDIDVTAGGDAAFATFLVKCGGTDGNGFDVRVTMGFKKINGEWAIAHEHHSVPAKEME